MKNFLKKFDQDESGQALTEYALIIALIAVVAIGVMSPLGTKIKEVFQGVTDGFGTETSS